MISLPLTIDKTLVYISGAQEIVTGFRNHQWVWDGIALPLGVPMT